MMEKVIKIVILVLVLVTGLGTAGCASSPNQSQSALEVGSPAPDFQLQSLDGQMVTLSGLRGRPVMLNFWTSWCGPCRLEMPFIQEAFEDRQWAEQGLVILAVNVGESSSRVKGFMEDNSLSLTVLLDTGLEVAGMYNVGAIPVTYFIDKNGIIKDRKVGSFSNKAEIDWRLIHSILDIA